LAQEAMMRHKLLMGVVMLVLVCTPARAHDFWIEPTNFAPEPAQVIGLRLRVGENLNGEPVALMPGSVKLFELSDAQQRRPVWVRGGADPAGAVRIVRSGLQIVAYTNDPNRVELAADKFNAYLAAEGLEHILVLRQSRHQSDAVARELYVRCAKSLLAAGPTTAAQGDRALGLPLELVAERNPYASDASQDMPLRLTYRQQPLAGALVVALNSLQASVKLSARTDRDGRVRLRLPPSRGLWLIKAVHMVEAPANAEDAQWFSYWASLTFAAAAATSPP
jgi:uncharacterized GH25 family protein